MQGNIIVPHFGMIAVDEKNPESEAYYVSCEAKVNANIDFDEVDKECAVQRISLIRLPEFVTKEVFDWAVEEASQKKGKDFFPVEFFTWEEGLCVQCMHIGPYDNEPATVAAMGEYTKAQGLELDFGEKRFHHEIYLSDVRRCQPERLKTVIRYPVKKT